MDTTMVPETEAQRELEQGESLLWAGQPDPKQMGKQSAPIMIFGVFWTAFSVFWMWGATTPLRMPNSNNPNNAMLFMFPIFGLPFVLIGIGMLTSPLWAAKNARTTVYAVTNRRILVIRAASTRSVKSFQAADIGDLEYTEQGDGSGTLTFGQHTYQTSKGGTGVRRDQFIGIPRVREVERLLRDTFQGGQGVGPAGSSWT
jgi:hypothetical protein